jgi:hypothetical protein
MTILVDPGMSGDRAVSKSVQIEQKAVQEAVQEAN